MVLNFYRSFRNQVALNWVNKSLHIILCSLLFACPPANWSSVAAEQAPPATASTARHAEDEQIIRAQSADYAKSFAKGDVAALAGMWAEDAVFTDDSGGVYRGREAIRNQIADFFNKNEKQALEVTVESIEFPSETTAIEHGSTCLLTGPSPENMQQYTAVHVKRDGKWEMVSVTESPGRAMTSSECLKGLNWLIGDWNTEGPGGKLHLKSTWVANGNLISVNFDTDEKDGSKTSQTEYIYWNPRSHRICSWQFDWSGGIGDAWWEKSGEAWLGHARSLLPDGRVAHALIVIQRVDDNTFSWQSTDRQVSGQQLPDTAKLLVKKAGV
jgi:uncharacterized protein (TIGR02246 family)